MSDVDESETYRTECATLLADISELLGDTMEEKDLGMLGEHDLHKLKTFLVRHRRSVRAWQNICEEPINNTDADEVASSIKDEMNLMKDSQRLKNLSTFNQCLDWLSGIDDLLPLAEKWKSASIQPALYQSLTKVEIGGENFAGDNVSYQQLRNAKDSCRQDIEAVIEAGEVEKKLNEAAALVDNAMDEEYPIDSATQLIDMSRRVAAQANKIDASVCNHLNGIDETKYQALRSRLRAAGTLADLLGRLATKFGDISTARESDAVCTVVPETVSAHQAAADLIAQLISVESKRLGSYIDSFTITTAEVIEAITAAQNAKCETSAAATNQHHELNFLEDTELVRLLAANSITDDFVASVIPRILLGVNKVLVDSDAVVGIESENGEVLTFATPFLLTGKGVVDQLQGISHTVEDLITAQQARGIAAAHDALKSGKTIEAAFFEENATSVGVATMLLLWTSLVEGTFTNTLPSPATASDDFTLIGSPTASRPQSAAARPVSAAVRFAKIASPLYPNAPQEPRPGSAAGGIGRSKTATKETKGRPMSADRPVEAALVRGRATPGQNGEWDEAANKVEGDAPTPTQNRPMSAKSRFMSALGRGRVSTMLEALSATLKKAQKKTQVAWQVEKFEVLLSFEHRLLQLWEQSLQEITDVNDYRWKREQRMYVRDNTFHFEMGPVITPLGKNFVSCPTFIVTSVHHEFFSKITTAASLHRGALGVGRDGTGKLLCLKFFSQLLHKKIAVLDCNATTTSRDVTRFFKAIASVGAMAVLNNVGTLDTFAQSAAMRLSNALLFAQKENLPSVVVADTEFAMHNAKELMLVATSSSLQVDDQIRNHFRCCHLPVCDSGFVFESILHANGFNSSKDIATKLTCLANVSRSLVSESALISHRVIAAAVRESGEKMRRQTSSSTEEHTIYEILRRGLPARCTGADKAATLKVLEVIFQGHCGSVAFPQLRTALHKVCSESGIHPTETLLSNTTALYEWLVSSTSKKPIVVVGEAGSGKSVLLETFTSVVSEMGIHHSVVHATGSQSVQELELLLSAAEPQAPVPLWMLVDGCNKNLSSFLEHVAAMPNVKVVIQTRTLEEVSFLLDEAHALDVTGPVSDDLWFGIFKSKVNQPQLASIAQNLQMLCEEHFLDCLMYSSHSSEHTASLHQRCLAFFSLIEATVTPNFNNDVAIERLFWYAATWSCAWEADSQHWVDFVSQRVSNEATPPEVIFNVMLLPDGSWGPWSTTVTNKNVLPSTPCVRALHLGAIFHRAKLPVLIVGPLATAKSLIAATIAGASASVVRDLSNVDTKKLIVFEHDSDVSTSQLQHFAQCVAVSSNPTEDMYRSFVPVISSQDVNDETVVQMLGQAGSSVAEPLSNFVAHLRQSVLGEICTMSTLSKICRLVQSIARIKSSSLPAVIRFVLRPLCSSDAQIKTLDSLLKSVDAAEDEALVVEGGSIVAADMMNCRALVRERCDLSSQMSNDTIVKKVSAVGVGVVDDVPLIVCGSSGSGYADVIKAGTAIAGSPQLNTVLVSTNSDITTDTAFFNVCGCLSSQDWTSALHRLSSNSIIHVISLDSIPKNIRRSVTGKCNVVVLEALHENNMSSIASASNQSESKAPLLVGVHRECGDAQLDDFQNAMSQFDELSTDALTSIEKRVVRASQTLKFTHRLFQDLQRKAVMSTAELEFNPDPDQPLRAFEGTINFAKCPQGAVRFIFRMNKNEEGISDVQQAAAFYSTPTDDSVFPPVSCGGSCKARVENPTTFTVQTGGFDFKLTMETVDGDTELQGTIFEPSAPSTAIGTVRLREVIELHALSRKWLRFGDGAAGDEETLSRPIELPTAEELGLEPDEVDKYFHSQSTLLKQIIEAENANLQEAFLESQDIVNTCLVSTVLPHMASLNFEERHTIASKILDYATTTWETTLCDPLSMKSFAVALRCSIEELQLWLHTQRCAKLPYGKQGDQCALFLKLLLQNPTKPILLVDDGNGFSHWLQASPDVTTRTSQDAASASGPCYIIDATASSVFRPELVSAGIILLVKELPPAEQLANFHLIDGRVSVLTTCSSIVYTSVAPEAGSPAEAQLRKGVETAAAARRSLVDATNKLEEFVGEHAEKSQQTGSKVAAVVAFGEKKIREIAGAMTTAQQELKDTAQFIHGSQKATKELESLQPLADRVAFLMVTTKRLLPQLGSFYAIPEDILSAIMHKALKATAKPNQSVVDAATREYFNNIIPTLLEEHRLLFCVTMGVELLHTRGDTSHGALSSFLRSLRCVDVASHLEHEKHLRQEAEVARQEWLEQKAAEQKNKKVVGKKDKDEKERNFLAPEVKPDYHFLQNKQWVNVLALTSCFPAFESLPSNFHESEVATKGPSRESKWNDWLRNPQTPIPTYEKDTSVGPLEKLALVLALRPDRTLSGLLQFVADVFGADFPDPFAPDDLVSIINDQKSAGSKTLLFMKSSGMQYDTVAGAATTAIRMGIKPDPKKPKEQPVPPQLVCRHASQDVESLLGAVNESFTNGDWLFVEDMHLAKKEDLVTLLNAVNAAPDEFTGMVLLSVVPSKQTQCLIDAPWPRFSLNPLKGIRAAMSRHYNSISSESLNRLPNVEWSRLMFVTSYIAAAIEQRHLRYNEIGFVGAHELQRTDSDLRAAISLLAKTAAQGEAIPWDELRALLAEMLGATLSSEQDRDVIRAYVDLLIHPDVVDESNASLGSSLQLPTATTHASHLSAINALNGIDSADLIGMHSNFEKRVQESSGLHLLETVDRLSAPKVSNQMAAQRCLELANVLPRWIPNDLAMLEAEASQSALCTFLYQEVSWLNAFVTRIRCQLNRIVEGDANSLDEEVATDLVWQRVPRSWQKETVEMQSLPKWVAALQRRHNQLVIWVHQGRPQVALLGGFHSPRAFFDAYLLDVCAETRSFVECNRVVLQLGPSSRLPPAYPTTKLSDGICLVGLQLDGAEVDDDGVVREATDLYASWWQDDLFPTPVVTMRVESLFADAPPSPIVPKQKSSPTITRRNMIFSRSRPSSASSAGAAPVHHRKSTKKAAPSEHTFAAPLYHNSTRKMDSFVGEVKIRTTFEQNHWKLRGVAVVTAPPE